MSKVLALISTSPGGYIANASDGVSEVFSWYFSGDVQFNTGGCDSMTFKVSPESAEHLRGLAESSTCK